MKEKVIIAHEAAQTARALKNSAGTSVTRGKENSNPNAFNLSVSVASAMLTMHIMDGLDVPSKTEIEDSKEREREKLTAAAEEATFMSTDDDDYH